MLSLPRLVSGHAEQEALFALHLPDELDLRLAGIALLVLCQLNNVANAQSIDWLCCH